MRFDKYLETQIKKEFAKKLGISIRALANYASGLRETPLGVALKIERLTHRKVTLEDLEQVYLEKHSSSPIAKISFKPLCSKKAKWK